MRGDLTQARVQELFLYDPITGVMINRVTRRTAKAGDVAGQLNSQGYRAVKVDGYLYSMSHIIWLYVTGHWPKEEMDHINRVRDDDRFVNLREASRSQNCINKDKYAKVNSLGYRGVQRYFNRFRSVVCVGQREYFVGTFDTLELAALAYDLKAKQLHGEFAKLNFPEKMHRDWLIP